jgi:hypothetical protein
MQTIRTDQQIALGATAVLELDPYPVAPCGDPDGPGVASDAFLRKAFQQPLQQDATRHHPHRCAQPVPHCCHVQVGQLATRRCHHPNAGQQLTCSVHVDAQLPQHRLAVRPDGHGTAAGLHMGALVENGDVMPVSQQPPSNRNSGDGGADDKNPKGSAARCGCDGSEGVQPGW